MFVQVQDCVSIIKFLTELSIFKQFHQMRGRLYSSLTGKHDPILWRCNFWQFDCDVIKPFYRTKLILNRINIQFWHLFKSYLYPFNRIQSVLSGNLYFLKVKLGHSRVINVICSHERPQKIKLYILDFEFDPTI